MILKHIAKASLPIQSRDLALLTVGSGKFQGITPNYEVAYPAFAPSPCRKRQFSSPDNAAYALLVQAITTNSILTEVSAFHGG
jgi:hypothetical protein